MRDKRLLRAIFGTVGHRTVGRLAGEIPRRVAKGTLRREIDRCARLSRLAWNSRMSIRLADTCLVRSPVDEMCENKHHLSSPFLNVAHKLRNRMNEIRTYVRLATSRRPPTKCAWGGGAVDIAARSFRFVSLAHADRRHSRCLRHLRVLVEEEEATDQFF